ncbi:hypothetical protein EC973_001190 [Apophysomyces ossiformis]|uniref:Isoleucine--tRNA ligase, mitochondrial n=1 Tax=Apophysomyces ossiformis TaxID=679940 RepID=A0A8H7BPE8_9FUNG|nr:hypothetical protein EC973_001190 [Apophysomyces ossiformis]
MTSTTRLAKAEDAKNPYSSTVLLPKTQFPLRADAPKREHLFRDRTTKELYPWQLENKPKDLFILHDGPPYANGNVHSGHAMNKILKDMVNRYKMLQGHKVLYRPGWDCHGLPIELKTLERLKQRGINTDLPPSEIRQLARKLALSEVEKQKEAFMSWAVIGDWDKPYKTLDKDYEVRQLRVFLDMVKKGYIYRQLKPVYWSPSSKSALAESELEYNEEHVSRSIHVRFPIAQLAPSIKEKWRGLVDTDNLYALIWTTTPWTIPQNRAIAIHPKLNYSVVKVKDGSHAGSYLIGTDRIEAFKTELGIEDAQIHKLAEATGKELIGTQYTHPLIDQSMPLIEADHVTAESGTGLVHSSPGHGMEDYDACLKAGIQPFSPLDDEGRYTSEVGLGLEGKEAFTEGTIAVIELLKDKSALVKEKKYVHKYPYDWRTKKPVMLRATAQWFANVENLQKEAVEALKEVRMVPEVSIRRLEQFTLSRKEWCISRQRSWGVPIPALYDVETGEALLTDKSVEHIIRVIDERGTDAWWEEEDDSIFVADEYKNNGKTYKRGYDTMDVWFDSGTSWTMMKDIPGRDPSKPVADMYLEGSDQHRGWFQSSLLTSIALTGKAPYSTLVTHGFALDEQGRKMSKSIGNTIEPDLITKGGKDKKKNPAYGSDVLRLWVASSEYTRDVTIGPTVIGQISDNMRKIRTTARFLLGNLNDFTYKACVPYNQLKEVDRYMLHELYRFNQRVTEAYDQLSFNRAVQHINNFTTNVLSAFYFDVIKDRLYNETVSAPSRRMAQTVLYEVLNVYTAALAPIVCHTAEEIYENYRAITPHPQSSFFKNNWLPLDTQWHSEELEQRWALLKDLKSEVNQVLEEARQEKVIRSSQEASIDLVVNKESVVGQLVHSMDASELASFFLTSRVNVHNEDTVLSRSFERKSTLGTDQAECKVIARKSSMHKCPRCRNYLSVQTDALCARCTTILQS